VSLMSQIMNRPVDTFSVGFEEENLNELPYARIAAQHFGTNHHEIGVNSCSPDLLKRLVWHLDEPVADPAAVPTYLVSELARRDVTVALTGEGGDELFAGYDYYRMDGWAQRRQILPSALSRRVLPALAGSVNTVLGRQRYHDRTIWHWSLPPEEQMVAWVAIFTADETNRLLSPAFRQYMQDYDSSQAFARYYSKCSARDRLHRLMYIDSKVWLPDDLLMKVDKMSMACSLEARSPFLDHKLVEFVSTIPSDMKLHGSDSKYVLKQVARQILPDEIVNRPKHTFDVPIGKWLRTDLRDLAREIVADGVIEGEDILNTEYVFGEMWRGLEGEQPGYARQFWSLVNLGLWARRFRMRLA
jgi:asparagine synthase (glutamine-hydrolysing)